MTNPMEKKAGGSAALLIFIFCFEKQSYGTATAQHVDNGTEVFGHLIP